MGVEQGTRDGEEVVFVQDKLRCSWKEWAEYGRNGGKVPV